VRSARLKLDLQGITDEERAILRTVLALTEQDTTPATTGTVFGAYKEKGGVVAERTFRKYLANLESLRILSSRLSGKGQRGNTRLITVRAPRTELTALLGEMY
jgi:Cdc6-like AAA superfamily ATPase